jgi:hypothetical protein
MAEPKKKEAEKENPPNTGKTIETEDAPNTKSKEDVFAYAEPPDGSGGSDENPTNP